MSEWSSLTLDEDIHSMLLFLASCWLMSKPHIDAPLRSSSPSTPFSDGDDL